MTTYKEYKKHMHELEKYLHLAYYSDLKGVYSCENYDGQENQVKLAEITEAGTRARFGSFIISSSVFVPEMMRIIDMAEEALYYALSQMQPFCSDVPVKNALLEIKKLKGE